LLLELEMKKPLKSLLLVLVLLISISLVVFSLFGYKKAEESRIDSKKLGLEEDEDWIKNPSNGHYYRLTTPMNWLQAEEQAVEWGGHLVTINDADENSWLVSTFGSSETFWIGFTDKDIEGSWYWISGENSTYTNWRSYVGGSEPTDTPPGEDVATINFISGSEHLPGKWNDLPINGTMRGIVEKAVTEDEEEIKIAFVSDRDEDSEIYIMNVDGSEQTNLTNNPARDDVPCFSPDGTKIAFESDRDGNDEIYIMNVDGSGQTNLTNNPADDYHPNFSPDGSKIAFTSGRDGGSKIYIMNVDGSGQTRLIDNNADDFSPCFSPDGTKIAFNSDHDGNVEIYIMNVDGSEQTRLTENPAEDFEPCFSPYKPKIAFVSDRDGNWEIYIMNVDGSNQTRLTDNQAEEWRVSFSPDGSRIAFTSDRDGDSEIYTMNTNGSDLIKLTNNQVINDWNSYFPSAYEPKYPDSIITISEVSSNLKVIRTNLILVALTMIPFVIATGLFTHTLAKFEEIIKNKILKMRIVKYLKYIKKKIDSFFGTKGRTRPIWRDIIQLLVVILFYGLAFSLLDSTWNPLSIAGLILFFDMAIAYGIVGIADDIVRWRTLKRWGRKAEFNVRPTMWLISITSILTSRLLRIVPGVMFGTPEALHLDQSELDRLKESQRNKLLAISATTAFVIGFSLWTLTFATDKIQSLNISATVIEVVSGIEGFSLVIFAVALENTFFQMLGFPGGFGYTLRRKNRWIWISALLGITFVFYHTLINPDGELATALEKNSVRLLLGVIAAFIVFTLILYLGLWLYSKIEKKSKKNKPSY
jgi:WD40 repeat protein